MTVGLLSHTAEEPELEMFKETHHGVFLNLLTPSWAFFAQSDLLTRRNQENISKVVSSVWNDEGQVVPEVTQELLLLELGAGLRILLVSDTGNSERNFGTNLQLESEFD